MPKSICRRACPLLVDFMRSFPSVLGNTVANSKFWELNSQPLPCDIPRSPDKTAQRRLRPSSCQDKSPLPTFHLHLSSYKDNISQTRQAFKTCYIVLSEKICFQTSILFEKSYNVNQKNITSTSVWSDETTLSRTFVTFWPNLWTSYLLTCFNAVKNMLWLASFRSP